MLHAYEKKKIKRLPPPSMQEQSVRWMGLDPRIDLVSSSLCSMLSSGLAKIYNV